MAAPVGAISSSSVFNGIQPTTLPPILEDNAPGCLNMTSPEEAVLCINETVAALVDKVEDLPECVEITLNDFATCAVDNFDTCAESCQGTPFSFDGLVLTDLLTCSQVQKSIMDPLCANNCCPPCQQALEYLAECIVNDVIHLTVRSCDLVCGARRVRKLLEGSLRGFFSK